MIKKTVKQGARRREGEKEGSEKLKEVRETRRGERQKTARESQVGSVGGEKKEKRESDCGKEKDRVTLKAHTNQ